MAPSPPRLPSGDAGNVRTRISKKVREKRQKEALAAMAALPAPLQDSDESSSDADVPQSGPPMAMNMNQSIFGLIAAAGSRVDFNERFDGNSSSEDSEDSGDEPGLTSTPLDDDDRAHNEDLTKTTILDPTSKQRLVATADHGRKVRGQDMLRSLPLLPNRRSVSKREPSRLSTRTDAVAEERLLSELSAAPSMDVPGKEGREPPVMSRMLEARAKVASRPSSDLERLSTDGGPSASSEDATPLALRLMQIFHFDEPEQVIEEYPCWLLQTVLLQGYLYITAKHICFYAYLPKKANVVSKSGFLSKSGKRNPKYNRYWFRLQGDVLSYYRDATNLYFPHGQIDLRFGISASVTDSDKDGVNFSIVTRGRTYNLRADSAPSAKEWVKSLQRVIFRSHNDGDSVKISMPIDNVIDVEDTQMMEFADTCKIRVIENDDTYAVDEYFFSFFSFGKDAIDVLKILVEDASSGSKTVDKILAGQKTSSFGLASKQESVPLRDRGPSEGQDQRPAVLTSLSHTSPHSSVHSSLQDSTQRLERTSLEEGGQSDQGDSDAAISTRYRSRRRSSSHGPIGVGDSRMRESSDSYIQSSMEDPSYSNLAASSTEDNSASQILRDSVVFHSPTMQRSPSGSQPEDARRKGREMHPAARFTPFSASSGAHAATTGHITAADEGQAGPPRPVASTPTLQSITKMGTYPLQRAGAFAGYLNETGKKMSNLLATESMGYVEKVSGMWKGGRKHYDEPSGMRPDEDELERDSEGKIQTSMERFRAHFALPETEKLQATYFGYILRVLPLYGKIYISDRSFCFRSLLPGTRTKLILPLKDIETVDKEKGFRFGYQGLVVVIRGHEEIFFEFGQPEVRDDCAVTLLQALETIGYLKESRALGTDVDENEQSAAAERDALREARREEWPGHEVQLPRHSSVMFNSAPLVLDDTDGSILNFKPQKSLRITCLTIGSRGDVQPYIALCKGLLAEGHKPRIATHKEFKGWIESHGIEFGHVEGDPGELMRLCIENGTFTWAFLREANATFRGWLDDLLETAYTACKGADVLIESPSAMAGIHIAEKLGIPYFRAFTMPWTRTRAYPHAFIMPEHKMGGAYNYMTYVMFDNLFWKAIAHQVNKWRNNTLGLPNTSLEKMQPNKVPFLYSFSPSVVAPPLDFSDWIRVSGYWFLDEGGEYEPPKELDDFMKKARKDGKKLVYVGFGSIIVNDPAKMTQEVIDAVVKADVRCILSKGWSDRISSKEAPPKLPAHEPVMPPEIHVIKAAPHDWLFSRVDAAAHHGGSGTTGASLRAGIPTIIRPFFGDQYFFASRVEDLGVGVWVKKWGTNSFGRALWEVTRNERMIVKSRVLGEQIRSERGVDTAIQCIYRDMEYAKSLIMRKAGKNARAQGDVEEEDDDDAEESWTFVGVDEPDPDVMTTRLSEGLDNAMTGQTATGSSALGQQV